jgi:hypothetical protein
VIDRSVAIGTIKALMTTYLKTGAVVCPSGAIDQDVWSLLEKNRLANILSITGSMAYADAANLYRSAIWSMTSRSLTTIYKLSKILGECNIGHIFLKGPLLAKQLYADPFFRMATDVDILIDKKDLGIAIPLMRRHSYDLLPECRSLYWRAFLGEQHFVTEDDALTTLDLHTNVRHPAGFSGGLTQALLKNRMDMALGNLSVSVPDGPDAYLLAAIYLVKSLLKQEPAAGHALDCALLKKMIGADGIRLAAERARDRGLATIEAFAQHISADLNDDESYLDPRRDRLRSRFEGPALWERIIEARSYSGVSRSIAVMASCDGVYPAAGSIAWEIARKVAQKACHAGLF